MAVVTAVCVPGREFTSSLDEVRTWSLICWCLGHARGVYVLSVPVIYAVVGGSRVDWVVESTRI